jgi:hypothetical protein
MERERTMSEKNNRSNSTIVPNDGSYLGAKAGKALRDKKVAKEFSQAWISQKSLLKDSLVKLYKDKANIGVQWQSYIDWDDSKLIEPRRVKRSLNALGKGKFPHTAKAVANAIAIAQEIDNKIKADSFSWLDYPQWMPKQVRPKDDLKPENKTIAQWIADYEADYWLSRDKNRYEDNQNWNKGYIRYFKYIKNWQSAPTKQVFDDACRSYPKSVKRNECCTRIKYLAQFCGLKGYDPKEYRLRGNQVKVKAKAKRELTDTEVEVWYDKFPNMSTPNGRHSPWQLWQWMFGMQAAYGFRNHETLNIFNLTEDYRGEDGKLYPAFIDEQRNPRGIIYTEGKGVKRAAFAPRPIKWLKRFNLRYIPQDYLEFTNGIRNYSEYQKKRAKVLKLKNYGRFLREHGFTFTAYNLRHHYNVKSHLAGVPASIIAKNLGHTLAMNTSIYLESQGIKSCLEALDNLENRQLKAEDEELTIQQQMEVLRQENEQLKALIQQLIESMKSEQE